MADELPEKEGQQAGTPQEKETPAAGELTETPVTEPQSEEGEPGGTDGTAVYARKEHRRAKQLEAELQQERVRKAELEGRLKAIEEKAKAPAPQQEITIEDVQAALDSGRINQAQATVYIADIRAKAIIENEEKKRQQRDAALRPIVKANEEIAKYIEVAPWLRDDGDKRTQNIGREYQRLVLEFGLPANEVTKAIAVQHALGPIERLQKQREVSELTRKGTGTHAENPGGERGSASEQVDLTKAPATMQAYWNKAGLSEAQRKKEYEIYKRLMERGR